MSQIPKLKVGQTLYREKKHRGPNEVEAVTVATVGTRYFTLEQEPGERFQRATLRHEHFCEYLRLTAEQITDEWARAALQRRLANRFSYQHLPLDKLRQVEALLSPAP